MGVVYEAEDRELGMRIALKLLPGLQPALLHRFKKEFRAAADIRHPNVVRFGDLFSDGDRWFFTMELVKGIDLLSHLRGVVPVWPDSKVSQSEPDGRTLPAAPAAPPASRPLPLAEPALPCLRLALSQLAQGLLAIHDSGQVHRDIKPSNVLATPEGRIVILDFGLATELDVRTTFLAAGTPAYMAPEQGLPDPVGPAADWYSVGVMLFEALTGVLPFAGESHEILYRKRHVEPPSIRKLVPSVPPALADLCQALLSREPERRPGARQILSVLGTPLPALGASQDRKGAVPLVDRVDEVAKLHAAFAEVAAGARLAVLISGEPGIGKTELCRTFLESLAAEQAATLVAARYHEREYLPLKALDSVIDQLARQMGRVGPEECAVSSPAIPPLLLRLFPALERVSAGHAEELVEIPADPQELRSRLLEGLREVLAAAAGPRPLVILVDDLQWADADSLAMFSALLADGRLGRVLFLGTFRPDSGFPTGWLDAGVRRIDISLPPLDQAATLTLLRAVFEAARHRPPELEPLAETTEGNPLFVKELARYALAHEIKSTRPNLADLLRDRVERTSPAARSVLDLLAIVGAPVLEQVVQAASGLAPGPFRVAVAELLGERLAQASGALGRERLELVHEQLRAWLWDALGESLRRALAGGLATALGHEADPAQVAALWLEAGENDKATGHLVDAGKRAMNALAFDRAARHFAMALQKGTWNLAEQGTLLAKQGDALAYAGRGAAAAEKYLAAAVRGASRARSLELYRRASGELLRSGYFDKGMEVAGAALAAAGMHLPTHPLLSLLWLRARLRLRRLRCSSEEETALGAEEAARIDLCWSLSSGLGLIDPLRGAYFQTRSLLSALRVRNLPRVGRGLAGEAAYSAAYGQAGARRAHVLLAEAEALAHRLRDPYAKGVTLLMAGMSSHLIGQFNHSRDKLEAAEAVLTGECAGAVWELDATRQFLMEDLYYLGDLPSFERLITTGLRQASDRGSLYAATNFRIGLANSLWLMQDDPVRARREADEAIARWSRRGFHVQHWYHLVAQVHAELYEGKGVAAHELVRRRWSDLRRTDFFHIQHTRIAALHLRARAALAAAQQSSGRTRGAYMKDAQRAVDKLRRQPDEWARALSQVEASALAALAGDAEAAGRKLAAAVRALEHNNLSLFAHAARVAGRARLQGGPADIADGGSEKWMRERGIANPTAIGNMLAPGLCQP